MAPLAIRDPAQQADGGEIGGLQARACRPAYTTGRAQAPAHVGLPVVDQPAPVPDLRHAQHHGECLAFPGAKKLEDRPRALQGALGKEADAVEMAASRALRHLLLVGPVAAVLPERLCPDLIRSPAVVVRAVCDGVEIARLGLGGEAPQWQVCQQPASARVHGHPPVRGAHHRAKRCTRIRKIEGRSA
jgi:hypothetical protein